jgi:hypothetical protein
MRQAQVAGAGCGLLGGGFGGEGGRLGGARGGDARTRVSAQNFFQNVDVALRGAGKDEGSTSGKWQVQDWMVFRCRPPPPPPPAHTHKRTSSTHPSCLYCLVGGGDSEL